MDIDEPGVGVVSESPGSVTDQVRAYNTFFKKNPKRFPNKHPSKVKLGDLKLIAAGLELPENSGVTSVDKTIISALGQEGVLSGTAISNGDRDSSSTTSALDSGLKLTAGASGMPIGVVPQAVSNSYTPPKPKAEAPEIVRTDENVHIEGDHEHHATSQPDVLETGTAAPVRSSSVASAVKFFESPSTPSPPAPSRKPLVEAGVLPAAEGDEDEPKMPFHGPSPADQKVDDGILVKGSKSTGKAPRTPSPTHSRGSPLKASSGRQSSERLKYTVPEPFSLSTDRRAALSARVPDLPTTPVPKPKAGIVRASFSSPKVPPKPAPKPATSPAPFRLESLKRHEEAQEKLKADIRAKEKAEEEKRKFKAQPIVPASPSPPRKSSPPTQSAGFNFACDERAAKRKEFLKKVEEKESQKQQEKRSILETTQAELEDQIKEYRKGLIFKAVPMPRFYNRRQGSEGTPPGTSKAASRRSDLSGSPNGNTTPPIVKPGSRRKSAGEADTLSRPQKDEDGKATGRGSSGDKKRLMTTKAGKTSGKGAVASPAGKEGGMDLKAARSNGQESDVSGVVADKTKSSSEEDVLSNGTSGKDAEVGVLGKLREVVLGAEKDTVAAQEATH